MRSRDRDVQQGVRYTIEAVLDETVELLRAAAILAYTNRSADTLEVLYLHLHLNAFRPNSLWARTEQRPEYDFQGLEESDYAFERLLSASIEGRQLAARYPGAPDSTVVELTLPSPLVPGGEARVDLRWEARLSTRCRRQCRSGRHYDFAQWYPRIAVYDEQGWQPHPLYPQGEFFGEFATYDVLLDVPDDQVIGATGVPVEGDPGWRPSGRIAGEPRLQETFYGSLEARPSPGYLPREVTAGRKRVRFHAEDVHHFAWIFGPYPYPQLTNVHRLEGGGTEFPMLVMNGSAGEGLILHEVAHQYVHGILANNEWREAWLDEGFASFLARWFREEQDGPGVWFGTLEGLARLERLGLAEPVSTPAEDFSSFQIYDAMSYAKPSVIFRMLRELLGEEVFRRLLREYYAAHRFQHVTESDLLQTAEAVSGRRLGWFFDAWLHGTDTLDYAVGDVELEPLADGRWRTLVEVDRLGEIWMPVSVRVGRNVVVAESHARSQLVEVVTSDRPGDVEIDPDAVLLDADRSNNRRDLD
ncbi:MAG: M1 family metallopeptidase [Gemmatimonadales bacterium]